ncbi:MAG: menaquinone biosynthesis protein [Acidobacteriota bacterium]|nr:MAG: menaquinone biosynthesis protein [Acidobacteriota bacterium]
MRISASTYLNSAPLVYSFDRGRFRDKYEFIGDAAPSRCADLLAGGACEIALIPAIEYQRIAGLRIIPDVAVASKSRVRSVILAARGPLSEARTVVLDTSSRTSQALVRILFRRRFGGEPRFTERTPDADSGFENMLDGSDAALVIGDPAFRIVGAADRLGITIYDLAEEWRGLTGLPFVFAVWAVRTEAIRDAVELTADFQSAAREGIDRLGDLAGEYARQLGMDRDDLLGYLRENVNYDLDEANIAGLEQYFRFAHEDGLIDELRDLSFVAEEAVATI